MNGALETSTSPDFQWSPEYEQVLYAVALSDYIEQDWNKLRDMIKDRLKENITSYMSDPPPPPPPEPPAAPELSEPSPASASTVTTLSPGVIPPNATTPVPAVGAKFPPFPRREENAFVRNQFNSYGRQKTVLTEEEAKEAFECVCTLLHEFEGNPPFTIQRLCELIVRPRQHFKYLGKYLRAVERSLLVTSTIDAFPIVTPEENAASSSPFMSIGSLREATTPLFSPIPFLHEDARRSRSRSPPMSPLTLATTATGTVGGPSCPVVEPLQLGPSASEAIPVPDSPVIGLVDELDDPGPGHLSDHPTAISSTTTMSDSTSGIPARATSSGKALFGGSLQERFIKSTSAETDVEMETGGKTDTKEVPCDTRIGGDGAAELGTANSQHSSGASEATRMAVDETEADKENVPKS